jgi:N utilization substance protein B
MASPSSQARSGRRRGPTPAQARARARRCGVQALYQWDLTGHQLREVETQFLTEREMDGVDLAYFRELLFEVPSHAADLKEQLAPMLDRPLARLDPVERAILLIGAYELTHRRELPYQVVINEGVELAKRFGGEQSYSYVNAVLDRLARKLREPHRERVTKTPGNRQA